MLKQIFILLLLTNVAFASSTTTTKTTETVNTSNNKKQTSKANTLPSSTAEVYLENSKAVLSPDKKSISITGDVYNRSGADIKILAANTPTANETNIYTHKDNKEEKTSELNIPNDAKNPLTLDTKGSYIKITKLKKSLKVGDQISIILYLDNNTAIKPKITLSNH